MKNLASEFTLASSLDLEKLIIILFFRFLSLQKGTQEHRRDRQRIVMPILLPLLFGLSACIQGEFFAAVEWDRCQYGSPVGQSNSECFSLSSFSFWDSNSLDTVDRWLLLFSIWVSVSSLWRKLHQDSRANGTFLGNHSRNRSSVWRLDEDSTVGTKVCRNDDFYRGCIILF